MIVFANASVTGFRRFGRTLKKVTKRHLLRIYITLRDGLLQEIENNFTCFSLLCKNGNGAL